VKRTFPLLVMLACLAAPAFAAPKPMSAGDSVMADLRAEAKALRPLVRSKLARGFLDGVPRLPVASARTVLRDSSGSTYWTPRIAASMSEQARARLVTRNLPPAFYYQTRYGTPLAYARPLELLGQAGLRDLDGKRVLDFGYGSIGQLRLLANLGAHAIGVDIDPLLKALYSDPDDEGFVMRRKGPDGRVTLVQGSFPGDASIATLIGGDFTLILSKNTLKRGYVHPEQPVDPRRMVHLGVGDSVFVREVFARLAPGGWFMIYNLCPAPAKPGAEYIPWADGHSPFPRDMLERAGFEVVAFDADDSPAARAMAHALGWDGGPAPMDLANDLFGMYTLARRPATPRVQSFGGIE
jgi:SAM-dependent methyltransferase